ncbi:MAG TPA: zf-HC2 domain-containing protein, partial [Pyrinomonadaceae bacterium]|nr:zf-HC2 domain-containing protein [Pyrinomonadaceae bacterium]
MYIDGELPHEAVAALDAHLRDCSICRTDLNEQKTFLLALSDSLENEREIELPKNFARTIVTKAESGVSGLRVRGERTTAIVIVSMLSLFVIVLLGGDAVNAFVPATSVLEQTGSVISFTGHLVYNAAYGVTVFLRTAVGIATAGGFALYLVLGTAATLSLLAASHQLRRF